MDLSHLRRACGVGLLTAAAFTNPTAHAANANVTVDINLPTVLVMYYYNTITLNLSQADLANYLAATAVPCAGDYCEDLGTATPVPGAITGGASTVPVAVSAAAPGTTTVNFTLQDAVGVRALGCATYTANYVSASAGPGVTITNGPVAGIDGQACSFTMTTGDLAFDLDLGAVADNTTVQAVFDVTVTGA